MKEGAEVGSDFSKLSALLELVRWMGRGLRGDGSSPLRLFDLSVTCSELDVPLEHISAGITVLRRISSEFGFRSDSVEAVLPEATAYLRKLEDTNRSKLGEIARIVGGLGRQPEPPMLLGDFASLLGIFGSLGAQPARLVTVGVAGRRLSKESVVEQVVSGPVFQLSLAPLGRLKDAARRFSRPEAVDGFEFRVPTRELMIVLLAARLGNPLSNPVSPTWLQLAVALKAWRERLDLPKVLSLAEKLNLEKEVHHGLAVVSSIFPELGRTIPVEDLKISALERHVAIPLAARRVVGYALDGGHDGGSTGPED